MDFEVPSFPACITLMIDTAPPCCCRRAALSAPRRWAPLVTPPPLGALRGAWGLKPEPESESVRPLQRPTLSPNHALFAAGRCLPRQKQSLQRRRRAQRSHLSHRSGLSVLVRLVTVSFVLWLGFHFASRPWLLPGHGPRHCSFPAAHRGTVPLACICCASGPAATTLRAVLRALAGAAATPQALRPSQPA